MDPTALCVDAIAHRLSIPVSSEIPPERPKGRFVQVSKAGGTESDFIDSPIMALVCWGSSDADASALATDCIHALAEQASDDPLLSHSELITCYRDEWGGTGESRYMVQLRLTINK